MDPSTIVTEAWLKEQGFRDVGGVWSVPLPVNPPAKSIVELNIERRGEGWYVYLDQEDDFIALNCLPSALTVARCTQLLRVLGVGI